MRLVTPYQDVKPDREDTPATEGTADESLAAASASQKENGGAPEQSQTLSPNQGAELSAEELLEDTERVYAPFETKAILFKNVPGSMKRADLEKVACVVLCCVELS